MTVWWHSLMAAIMMLVLANPLCACDAQKPVADSQESISCCTIAETSETPEPADSSTPSPCNCESAVHEGLFQAKQDLTTNPVAMTSQAATQTPYSLIPLEMRSFAFSRTSFLEPPLRHRFSVYRL